MSEKDLKNYLHSIDVDYDDFVADDDNVILYDNVINVMSVEEVSAALGVSDKTVYRLLHEKKIEHIMMGRKYRIPKAHLFSYLRLCSKDSEKT